MALGALLLRINQRQHAQAPGPLPDAPLAGPLRGASCRVPGIALSRDKALGSKDYCREGTCFPGLLRQGSYVRACALQGALRRPLYII